MPQKIKHKIFRKIRNNIPNAITILAMCLGLTALNLSYVRSDIYLSLLLLLAAAILDAMDGRVARKLNIVSPVGAQLDSLADFLNFCICPALIMYEWVFKDFYFFGWFVTLIYLVAGAYRLARFNVMYTQGAENVESKYFIGMPSPAGAIMVFAPIILTLEEHINSNHIVFKSCYVVAIALMMASTIRTPSLKNMSLPKKYRKYAAVITILVAGIFILEPVGSYLCAIFAYGFSIIYVNIRRQRALKKKNIVFPN